ncbi:MAG: DUF3489 domain-containing protein, partial [Gammaproteobacteria bacterium]|nr:DUF3489 domain-containing protein [Gammaproteobacteria bacterium]
IKPRVIQGLLNRDLITAGAEPEVYHINAKGFMAIGASLPTPEAEPVAEPIVQCNNQPTAPRKNTKQAQMIALMQRPEGASIRELCTVTGWQKHTVRGTFSNTLKKRLGLMVTSCKAEGQSRRYRINEGDMLTSQ